MSAEEVLYRSPMLYTVLRDTTGALVIEVVAGGAVMYEVRVRLEPPEVEAWQRDGATFTDGLAQRIAAEPTFGGRASAVGG